jgi:beta-glucosidase
MTDWFGGYNGFGAIRDQDAVSDVVNQLKAGNDLLMPGLLKKMLITKIKPANYLKRDININLTRVLELVMRSPAMTNSEYSNKPHLKENAHFTRDAVMRRLFY